MFSCCQNPQSNRDEVVVSVHSPEGFEGPFEEENAAMQHQLSPEGTTELKNEDGSPAQQQETLTERDTAAETDEASTQNKHAEEQTPLSQPQESPRMFAGSKQPEVVVENSPTLSPTKPPAASNGLPLSERRKCNNDPPYCADGAYLVYSEDNDGSFFVVWRQERPDNAVAYAKPAPAVRIPAFKFKGRTELARNLHKNRKAAMTAALHFLRSMKPFQCRCSLLDLSTEKYSKIPQFTLFTHNFDGKVTAIYENSPLFNIVNVDCVVGALLASPGEAALSKIADKQLLTVEELVLRAKQNTQYTDYVQFNRD